MRQLLMLVSVVLAGIVLLLDASAATPAGSVQARWVGRDLGGFGGPYRGSATALNERGQVVGSATTTTATGSRTLRTDAFLWQDGRFRDLGVHSAGLPSNAALEINERGQVLGLSTKSDDKGGTVAARLWLWQAGRVRTILARSDEISGVALNDRGQVLASVGIGPDSALFWQDGRLTRIGGPGAVVRGLNNRGQVVGYTQDGPTGTRAFLWQAGKMTDLGTLGGRISEAVAINDRGQVVGWSESRRTAAPGVAARSHAFIWEAGRMTDLGTLGGPLSFATAINERGDVVGTATTGIERSWGFVEHVFLWKAGTMTDIDPPGLGVRLGDLDNGSYPIALNNQGQVLTYRYCCGGPQFGFVSEDATTTRLGPLSAKGWSMPAAINDHGLVVGSARVAGGQDHPVLWQRQVG